MLKNYIKIAYRNLIRHKSYSFINIIGLSVGMACAILIMIWVQFELSYEQFNANASRLYRITSELPDLGVKAGISPAPLAHAFKKEIPEIKEAARISTNHTDLLQVDDRMFEEKGIWFVDSTFLKMFSFEMIQGDIKTALDKPESIVITKKMAQKYFGNEPTLGKTIKKNHSDEFVVTGVLADLPENTQLQFDFLQPMSFLAKTNDDLKHNTWDNFNFYTFLEFDESFVSSPETFQQVEQKFNTIYKANEPNLKVVFHLQQITDMHLHSNNFMAELPGIGNAQYVYIFIVVGIFIIVVACINFMNLATARSARRAKEVGLRKVAGALRFQLIRQFLAESSLIAFIALVLAILIVTIALPGFNILAGKNLTFEIYNPTLLLSLIGITVLTGLLAGSYPALFLSGFVPAKVLKGNIKAGAAGSMFRNSMVVIQFSVSIILLVGTGVVYNQLDFIRNRNLGFDRENLIYFRMSGDLWKKYETLRSTLEQNELTKNFSFVEDLPTNVSNATIGVEWEGKDPNSQPLFSNLAVDDNFMKIFNTKLLNGRTFSKDIKSDTSNLIVNEEALKTLNLTVENAVGTSLTMWNRKGTIIGVVKNFNFKPIQQPIEALILRYDSWGGTGVVRANAHQTEATIKALEGICKTLNPEFPFAYNFVDQDLDKLYRAEQQLGNLFTVFVGLAIFISCLGLYGLSAFLAERRTKEIGVRKVLGASVFNVVYLLSKTFTVPIVIAMVIASPLAWYFMNQWLETFAFHVDIHWSIFAIAFLLSISIAWLTVSYESLKAAIANPAKSLRDE